MSEVLRGAALRRRRVECGLSQRQLALLSGIAQPNIAAYENERRLPGAETSARLNAALSVPTMDRLRAARDGIHEAAMRRRLSDIRVFGSVARGDAVAGSDVDLLVHPGPDASIFDLAGFMSEVEDLLGLPVDVVSDRGSGPVLNRILAEAVPL